MRSVAWCSMHWQPLDHSIVGWCSQNEILSSQAHQHGARATMSLRAVQQPAIPGGRHFSRDHALDIWH